MEAVLSFPAPLVSALTVLFAVCILAPAMYYVWNVYKRKLSHPAILGGLCCFFLFGYWLSGVLLGLLAPEARMASLGMWGYGLRRAVCVAVSEVGGMSLLLWFLHRSEQTIRVPIGFGLGFRLFDMLYLGAMNTLIRLSYAMTVNREGLDAVLTQVEEGQRPELLAQLQALSGSSPRTYWLSAVDYACMFALTVALSRLLWYAFADGRKAADRRFLPLVLALRFVAELLLALYAAGGRFTICAAAYYVLTAAAVCLAFYVSRRRDDPEQIRAEHLKGKTIRRRR